MKRLLPLVLFLLLLTIPVQAVDGRVGVIGCSNTKQGAQGYEPVSTEDRLWPSADLRGYGGKTVEAWANPQSKAWLTVNRELADQPDTSAIWWQLCIRTDELTTLQTAQQVFNLIRQRTQVPIYASPLDATPTCRKSDEVRTAGFIDQMVAAGQVLYGPVMSPLTPAQTQPDNCHASSAGLAVWGQDLADFFDG